MKRWDGSNWRRCDIIDLIDMGGDLDDITDGTTYGKILNSYLTANKALIKDLGQIQDDLITIGKIKSWYIQATAPSSPAQGAIWLDTSETPPQMKEWNGTSWKRMDVITLIDMGGDLDDIDDGATYGKILLTQLSAGKVLLAQVEGDLDDVDNGTTYGKILLTDIQAGHIKLTECVGDLDDIDEGTTYGKVLLTSISAGKILVSELDGTLDNMGDGTTYGRVKLTCISAGEIILSGCSGDLDDIGEGTTYGKVLLTSLSAGKILLSQAEGDLDDIANGTYGKVLTADISAGHIKLSSVEQSASYRTVTDTEKGTWNSKENAIYKQSTAPTSPSTDDLWIDTSTTPNIWKRWTGTAWVICTPEDIDDIGDGATYGRILLTDIQAGHIKLSEAVGDLDDIGDGTTYAKVKTTDIEAGHVKLSECTGTIDNIDDGTTYGKVKLTNISAGKILLSECTGDLDDIGEGTTYGKVLLTSLSAGKILLAEVDGDLDDVVEGMTYGKVKLTNISAGNIKLVVDQNLGSQGFVIKTAASGARVELLPDANTGLLIKDNAGADVLKAFVGGADIGDLIIGNFAGNQGVKWDKSAGTFTIRGVLNADYASITNLEADNLKTGALTHSNEEIPKESIASASATGVTISNVTWTVVCTDSSVTYISNPISQSAIKIEISRSSGGGADLQIMYKMQGYIDGGWGDLGEARDIVTVKNYGYDGHLIKRWFFVPIELTGPNNNYTQFRLVARKAGTNVTAINASFTVVQYKKHEHSSHG